MHLLHCILWCIGLDFAWLMPHESMDRQKWITIIDNGIIFLSMTGFGDRLLCVAELRIRDRDRTNYPAGLTCMNILVLSPKFSEGHCVFVPLIFPLHNMTEWVPVPSFLKPTYLFESMTQTTFLDHSWCISSLKELGKKLTTEGPYKVEGTPRRVRGLLGGKYVFDTTAARYVWEHPYCALRHSCIHSFNVLSISKAGF